MKQPQEAEEKLPAAYARGYFVRDSGDTCCELCLIIIRRVLRMYAPVICVFSRGRDAARSAGLVRDG